MAQTIGAYAGMKGRQTGQPVKIGFLIGARKYRANYPVFHEDQILRIEARLSYTDNVLGAFDCSIKDMRTEAGLAESMVKVYHPENVEEFFNRKW
jgi:predicted hotdog family 3-hydroxylacyl-ACP dehydratase